MAYTLTRRPSALPVPAMTVPVLLIVRSGLRAFLFLRSTLSRSLLVPALLLLPMHLLFLLPRGAFLLV